MNEFDLMIFLAERILVLGADSRCSSGDSQIELFVERCL